MKPLSLWIRKGLECLFMPSNPHINSLLIQPTWLGTYYVLGIPKWVKWCSLCLEAKEKRLAQLQSKYNLCKSATQIRKTAHIFLSFYDFSSRPDELLIKEKSYLWYFSVFPIISSRDYVHKGYSICMYNK